MAKKSNALLFGIALLLIVGIDACSTKSEPTHFYLLQGNTEAMSPETERHDTTLLIGPITMDGTHKRKEILLWKNDRQMTYSEFSHWVMKPTENMYFVLAENIRAVYPKASVMIDLEPAYITPKYNIALNFRKSGAFDGETVGVRVDWFLIDSQTNEVMIAEYFDETETFKADDIDAFVDAYGRVLFKLSQDITKKIRPFVVKQ